MQLCFYKHFHFSTKPEHDSEYAESVVKHLIEQSEKLPGKKSNHLKSRCRLLLRDKVLADELLVEHVEKVVKVLLKELIRKNLVPKVKQIFQ